MDQVCSSWFLLFFLKSCLILSLSSVCLGYDNAWIYDSHSKSDVIVTLTSPLSGVKFVFPSLPLKSHCSYLYFTLHRLSIKTDQPSLQASQILFHSSHHQLFTDYTLILGIHLQWPELHHPPKSLPTALLLLWFSHIWKGQLHSSRTAGVDRRDQPTPVETESGGRPLLCIFSNTDFDFWWCFGLGLDLWARESV